MSTSAASTGLVDQRLLHDIRSGNCVAFVGAGFSAAAELPDWKRLLRRLSQEIPQCDANDDVRGTLKNLLEGGDEDVSNHELEMAAQLLFDTLGEAACRERLNGMLKKEPLPGDMERRLRFLFGIPFRAIVTTNFDSLISGEPPGPSVYRRLLQERHDSPWETAIAQAALGLSPTTTSEDVINRPVVQLHGTLRHKDAPLVFARSQYRRRLYATPAYLTVLRALLATSTVLFLGYSLRDAYLNELRAELVEAFQGGEGGGKHRDDSRPLAWAVLEDVSEVACDYYGKHEGLGVIPYRTQMRNNKKDHSGFDLILKEIYDHTNPIHRLGELLQDRRLLWFDPEPSNNDLGRKLLSQAVQDVRGSQPKEQMLVAVTTLDKAIQLAKQPWFDLIISHWGHGVGPNGQSNGEVLLREIAGRRATGQPQAPVVVFAGQEHEAENRRKALSLGALAYTSEWQKLMDLIERVLDASTPWGYERLADGQ